MEVRRRTPNNEVAFRASTADASLVIGDPPNSGHLIINVDHEIMKQQTPGLYFADIVGIEAPEFIRRCVTIDLEIDAMGRAARNGTIVAATNRWSAPCHSPTT